jgi:hypothetical protein
MDGTGTTETDGSTTNVGALQTAPDGTGAGSVSEIARSDPPPIWSHTQGPVGAP